jgi:hypothetical protein
VQLEEWGGEKKGIGNGVRRERGNEEKKRGFRRGKEKKKLTQARKQEGMQADM